MRILLALIIALPLLAMSLEAEAGLVEDLRSGKSDVKTVSQVGSVMGLAQAWRKLKSYSDYKAIAYHGPWNPFLQTFYGAYSAEQAVESALKMCEEKTNGRCRVYSVGAVVVTGDSQEELADVIEAYQLEVSGNTATKPKNVDFKYCRTDDGRILFTVMSCASNTEITKAEYDRLKNKKKDTVDEPPTKDKASENTGSIKAKLKELKDLLDEGLITEKEAAAKRAKLLEEL
jgi:hypothetical protein